MTATGDPDSCALIGSGVSRETVPGDPDRAFDPDLVRSDEDLASLRLRNTLAHECYATSALIVTG